MNFNTFKNSLDPNTVNLNDRFNRAQWKFSPPDLDEEISKDIHMGMQNKVNNTIYMLLGYNTREINHMRLTSKIDPICSMFEKMKARQMDSCPILCCNPDEHFKDKKCYPIYKVYQVLKKIDENASRHLHNEEFRNSILSNVNDQEKLLSQAGSSSNTDRIYSIFSIPENILKDKTIKKKIVLVIDFLDAEMLSHDDDAIFYTGLNNLLENIDQNFTCMLSPALKMKEDDRWMNFLSDQIKNCNLMLLLFSPKMVENIIELRANEFDDGDPLMSTSKMDPLKFLWTSVMNSHKPLAGVIFDENLTRSVSSMLPVIFHLPKNMKLLLGYLIHRLQKI